MGFLAAKEKDFYRVKLGDTQNNPSAADKCQSAREKCMATGNFTGPQGKSVSGLAKQ
jgi:hypothetical protein